VPLDILHRATPRRNVQVTFTLELGMTPEYFVDALKTHCRDAAVEDCASLLERPPGRRPEADLIALSKWFKSLPDNDRRAVLSAMRMAADATLFGVFCVMDGVRVVEDGPEKSDFRLTATRAGATADIAPGSKYLHEILRAEP
jgi:hypothetical protein